MRASGYVGGAVIALGIGAAFFVGHGVASAAPDTASVHTSVAGPARAHKQTHKPANRPSGRIVPKTARRELSIAVHLPPMPVRNGLSFTVSPDFMKGFATDYVDAGGDPADSARFFFGDLAVKSLDALAEPSIPSQQARLLLGNLAASGYFGGIWLRDNLSGTTAGAATIASVGIRLFDALSAGLTGASARAPDWLVSTVAHASVPVLLALYGYNRGYLQVVLEHPPAGVPSMQDTLTCQGFLDCNSTAFPLELATRYDSVLGELDHPDTPGWAEMALWTTVLNGATSAGRFVWEGIARSGFSPASYTALVELSSAYLMVSKAAVLSSMAAYADGDAATGRSSLRLQAGLWMWSGAYFSGLASGAGRGTIPTITVS
ncbi:hypothetical protein FHT40_003807 [Mycolicibacterium sp. BK556]|uniref:hypothetical protein n=1 Tax=Mycobacteriaceae TaxID=1762 RepID=UPI00105C9780|nr:MULTISPECIES: hypothetical protein [Mycobacteriaceae]MBB3604146.1 hypothetical protein [Mycolicibacterium sp. BK556]MBB3634342.1 hypothetical protein [Mycolicibacterium sp. BK607]MBB3751922.1 hypothetical protein [Mycolicibacterium sp. BK634]TDO12437.1 hypothetical protein EV580_4164 [Mycobacterium sp. BK086]